MERLFLTNRNIDDPYLAVKEFYNIVYSSGLFLNVIYSMTKNIGLILDGASADFDDEYGQPLKKFVHFTYGFNENFEPAEDIMVPIDFYKKLTLEAIDAYQQKNYDEGLANIREKFLPK